MTAFKMIKKKNNECDKMIIMFICCKWGEPTPYKLGDEFMRTNQPNRVSMEQLTKADELTLQM
jgi:hypothetical protein